MALIDNFESYAVGELVGNGTWTGTTGNYSVENTITHTGSRAVSASGLTAYNNPVGATFTISTDASQIFYYQTDSDTYSDDATQFYEGATFLLQIAFGGGGVNTGKITYYNGSWVEIQSYTANTWYKVQVDWRSSDHKFQVTIDNGTPTGWVSAVANFTTGVDKINIRANSGGNSYWDDFSGTPIFEDYFNRADSASVGGAWTETDPSGMMSIFSDTLRMQCPANDQAYIYAPSPQNNNLIITFSLDCVTVKNTGPYEINVNVLSPGSSYLDGYGTFFFIRNTDTNLYWYDAGGGGLTDGTSFNFQSGTTYDVEIIIKTDYSAEVRVWDASGSRPGSPTFTHSAQTPAPVGTNYHIGIDGGNGDPCDIRMDDFIIANNVTSSIKNVSGVAQASISKVSGVANASISKISGVSNTS